MQKTSVSGPFDGVPTRKSDGKRALKNSRVHGVSELVQTPPRDHARHSGSPRARRRMKKRAERCTSTHRG